MDLDGLNNFMALLVRFYYRLTNNTEFLPSDLLALHVPNLAPLLPSLAMALKIEKNITQCHGCREELHVRIKSILNSPMYMDLLMDF